MEWNWQEILEFWFGELNDHDDYPLEKSKLWFRKDDSMDEHIRDRFSASMDRVATYPLETFLSEPRRALAAILLFDQFTRNSFRDTPDAYDYDRDALEITRKGIDATVDQSLRLIERAFFYMPLMHAEIKSVQKLSLRKYKDIVAEATPRFKPHAENFYKYAEMHADIVLRFGRFPHRNGILGRKSSDEEEAFLRLPGSSF